MKIFWIRNTKSILSPSGINYISDRLNCTVVLVVKVLEEEKSKMEEVICKKDDKLRELGPHLANIVQASK